MVATAVKGMLAAGHKCSILLQVAVVIFEIRDEIVLSSEFLNQHSVMSRSPSAISR